MIVGPVDGWQVAHIIADVLASTLRNIPLSIAVLIIHLHLDRLVPISAT